MQDFLAKNVQLYPPCHISCITAIRQCLWTHYVKYSDFCSFSCFRTNLPIIEAVIQEILRKSCIAPLGVSHYTQKDLQLQKGKFLIPAGTTILPNIYHIVNNPKEFPDPEKFNPDRFLDVNGKYVKHNHNII